MQLRSVDKDKIILNPAVSFDLQNDYHSAKDLLKYPQALLECKDINKDSWCDYEVLFERAAAGAIPHQMLISSIRLIKILNIQNYSAVPMLSMTALKT
jgi:hypothetical protein